MRSGIQAASRHKWFLMPYIDPLNLDRSKFRWPALASKWFGTL